MIRPQTTDHSLPQATAEQILSNVFSACSREPNSIPLEALTSYSNYRKERYALQRTMILLMLALFILLPLLFLAADIRLEHVNAGSNQNPVYAVSVDTQIPIRQIEARLNGQTVPLHESSPGEYTASPRSNGEMHILVTLINKQMTALDATIDGVDTDAPALLSTDTGDSVVYFFVEDTGSGVDYDNITITAADGNHLPLIHADHQTGCITLPYPTGALRVRIPDLRGNALDVSLKPQP